MPLIAFQSALLYRGQSGFIYFDPISTTLLRLVECRVGSANRVPIEISKEIGKRLRELCQERGIPVLRVDACSGLNVGSLGDVESGKTIISISKLAMIALSCSASTTLSLRVASLRNVTEEFHPFPSGI